MAKVKFEDYQNNFDGGANTGANGTDNIGFFKLSNDKDEAVVRFICDSTDDFETYTVHDVTIDGKFRRVNCIGGDDPGHNCPLCESGNTVKKALIVKMLVYDTSTRLESGAVPFKPMTWSRPFSFAYQLKNLLDNNGPLTGCLFKIIRNGAAGSTSTSYSIIQLVNKQMYPDELYPIDTSAFNGFNILGRLILDKSYADMNHFLTTGSFPQRESQQQQSTNNVNAYNNVNVSAPVMSSTTGTYNDYTGYTSANNVPNAPATSDLDSRILSANPKYNVVETTTTNTEVAPRRMPWENVDAVQRPVRN